MGLDLHTQHNGTGIGDMYVAACVRYGSNAYTCIGGCHPSQLPGTWFPICSTGTHLAV